MVSQTSQTKCLWVRIAGILSKKVICPGKKFLKIWSKSEKYSGIKVKREAEGEKV